MTATGWYQDPFEQHDARWFSDGRPTSLVRDGRIEARDDPPTEPVDYELIPVVEHPVGGDLLRADANTRSNQSYDARAASRAMLDEVFPFVMPH